MQRRPTEIHITGILQHLEPKFGKTGKVWCDASVNYQGVDLFKKEKSFTMPFKVFGDSAEEFAKVPVGSQIKVALDIQPNEYQGKNYINANLIQHKILSAPIAAQPTALPTHVSEQDIPF